MRNEHSHILCDWLFIFYSFIQSFIQSFIESSIHSNPQVTTLSGSCLMDSSGFLSLMILSLRPITVSQGLMGSASTSTWGELVFNKFITEIILLQKIILIRLYIHWLCLYVCIIIIIVIHYQSFTSIFINIICRIKYWFKPFPSITQGRPYWLWWNDSRWTSS